MQPSFLNQWSTLHLVAQYERLDLLIEAFLTDRKAANMSPGTIFFYRKKFELFMKFCESQAITRIDQITPDIIRAYLLHLEDTGHNPGGRHACFRVLRTLFYWLESEQEGFKSPVRKVKPPRIPQEIIKPVELEDVSRLVNTCKGSGFHAARDLALLLFLLDTGARAAETLNIDLSDLDLISSGALIRSGKGRKPRTVFFGKQTRRALRAYLKTRQDYSHALWVTDEGDRLQYWGLREILRRRAKIAGVEMPSPHDFRRAFAINMLRNGTDLITLQRLMGHTSLVVLNRYLAQVDSDLKLAHAKASPVDNLRNISK